MNGLPVAVHRSCAQSEGDSSSYGRVSIYRDSAGGNGEVLYARDTRMMAISGARGYSLSLSARRFGLTGSYIRHFNQMWLSGSKWEVAAALRPTLRDAR